MTFTNALGAIGYVTTVKTTIGVRVENQLRRRISKCFTAMVWPSASNPHPQFTAHLQVICRCDERPENTSGHLAQCFIQISPPRAFTSRESVTRAQHGDISLSNSATQLVNSTPIHRTTERSAFARQISGRSEAAHPPISFMQVSRFRSGRLRSRVRGSRPLQISKPSWCTACTNF